MPSTSSSLLEQLRSLNHEEAWQRFVDLYSPLIFHWGTRRGLNADEASDLVQEVMAIMVVQLPEFEYDPTKSFRGWLRVITLRAAYKMRKRQRDVNVVWDHVIQELEQQDSESMWEEQEYRALLLRRALQIMKSDFQERTWRACWELVANQRPVAEVAQELNMTPNAVYLAKFRVLRRLRQELAGLLD